MASQSNSRFTAAFDYFRLPPEKWELLLTRLSQLGISTVTLSLPWGFHQYLENHVDFTGNTNARRNIVDLIKLCVALNLECWLMPGPTYPAGHGLLNHGLPVWLSPEQALEPEAVKRWFNAFSKPLAPFQSFDGPISALLLRLPANSPTQQPQLSEVKWPIWLRKQYDGIDALNAAYGTNYRSVSQVPFPSQWPPPESSPLVDDAQAFWQEIQRDTRTQYRQWLVEAGWQIPIITLPDIVSNNTLSTFTLEEVGPISHVNTPIQVEPDPPDVGSGPSLGANAVIRADGSPRKAYWPLRNTIWNNTLPNITLDQSILKIEFEAGGLVTAGQDTPLNVSLPKGSKPNLYQLYCSGQLAPAKSLRVSRAKLRGDYHTEDETGQTDLILYLDSPDDAPLDGFVANYLGLLLKAQVVTLNRCAAQAVTLSQTLSLTAAESGQPGPETPKPVTPYSISEARRGLSKAEMALKKAMASIGGLEAGFETMLSKPAAEPLSDAPEPVKLSPEIFEGAAQDTLLEAGQACAEIADSLVTAAKQIESTLPTDFSVARYRQSYALAVAVAQAARDPLLSAIAQLRLQIAAEQLPLVAWRVHNQLQAIADSLRWGVLRG